MAISFQQVETNPGFGFVWSTVLGKLKELKKKQISESVSRHQKLGRVMEIAEPFFFFFKVLFPFLLAPSSAQVIDYPHCVSHHQAPIKYCASRAFALNLWYFQALEIKMDLHRPQLPYIRSCLQSLFGLCILQDPMLQ